MLGHVHTAIKKIVAGFALLSIELIILLLVFSVALTAFILTIKSVFANGKTAFDNRVFNYLSLHVNNINTSVMGFFSFLGTHLFLIPANIVLIIYFLFIKKHKWYSIKIPVIAVSSLLLMFVLKYIFHRDRPITPLLDAAKGFSFPSGHAMMSVTFYGLLIAIGWQYIKKGWLKWIFTLILSLLIFAIGLSRVYLRVHYASDVLAGFCVGCMWLLLSLWILGKMEFFSRKKVDPIMKQEL
jgi:membrane-associated phospholipid phosphatase